MFCRNNRLDLQINSKVYCKLQNEEIKAQPYWGEIGCSDTYTSGKWFIPVSDRCSTQSDHHCLESLFLPDGTQRWCSNLDIGRYLKLTIPKLTIGVYGAGLCMWARYLASHYAQGDLDKALGQIRHQDKINFILEFLSNFSWMNHFLISIDSFD